MSKQRVVFKYQLMAMQTQSLQLPLGAELLDVQMQDDHMMLWVLQDPHGYETEERRIHVIGTGWMLPQVGLRHVGTVQQFTGLVWHVFEEVQDGSDQAEGS